MMNNKKLIRFIQLLENNIKSLHSHSRNMLDEINSLRKIINQKELDINTLTNQNQELVEENKKLKESNEALKKQISEIKYKLSNALTNQEKTEDSSME